MDWTKQAQDMFTAWSGTQQKMMESWTETMRAMATPQAPGAWEKTVATWRSTVRKALESQVELTRLWSESMAAGMGSVSMPREMTVWTSQMLEMNRNWTEAQMRFSESWFTMLEKSDPSVLARNWRGSDIKGQAARGCQQDSPPP